MATFEAQVEALTGIAIDGSSDPTLTELSVFLQDGVKDVIHRMIEARPEELARFCSTTDSGSNAFVAKVGKILSVTREHDSTSILRKCSQIDPGDRYDATDVDSLNYRSKTNPGFYELNGKIHTVPVAAESGDNNVVVTQLFYDTGVAYGDEVPDNFPESYAYLVALYAAVKSINNNMAGIIADLSSFSITTVPPDFASVYDEAAAGNTIDDDIAKMLTYIETNEDVELANAKASEVQLRFKRALDEFQSGLGKYSAEIQGYAQEVAAEVSEQGQKVQTEAAKYQWLQDRGVALQAEYMAAFGIPQPAGGGGR